MSPDDVPLWPSVEAFCVDLARWVEARVDPMVDAVLDAISEKVPAYGSLTADEARGVREGVAGTVGLFLRTLTEAREITTEEAAFFEAVGAARAEQRVSLDEIRDAVRAANGAGYDHLHAEALAVAAEHPDHPVDLPGVLRHLTLHSQEFYATQWAALQAGHAGVDRDRQVTAASSFFDGLLRGGLTGEAEIRRAAGDAGYRLDPPCALLALVPANGDPSDLSTRVRTMRAALPEPVVSPMRFDPHPHVVALVTLRGCRWPELVSRVAEAAMTARLVVVAEPAPHLESLGPVYQGLRQSLAVAPRLRPRVVRAVDLGHMRAAGSFDPDERFLQIDSVLGEDLARRADYAQMAIDTLKTLRSHRGDVEAAAHDLGISVSSVYRRLDGIAARSHLDFDNPRDLAVLGWVVSLYSFDPDSLPPPGDPAWGQRARGIWADDEDS